MSRHVEARLLKSRVIFQRLYPNQSYIYKCIKGGLVYSAKRQNHCGTLTFIKWSMPRVNTLPHWGSLGKARMLKHI